MISKALQTYQLTQSVNRFHGGQNIDVKGKREFSQLQAL